MPGPDPRTGPGPGARPLAGLRVWLGRSPDRAAAAVTALEAAGAEVRLMPLIGFRPVADPAALHAAVDRLARGGYAWVVFTSVTTVLALERVPAVRDADLRAVVGAARVAAVGEGTRAALAARGVPVHLVPRLQSAVGLLAEWPADGAAVLLPQSSIARPALYEGLLARGCAVDRVSAYDTVDWPAGEEALEESAAAPPAPLDAPEQLAAEPADGGARAVVLSSPSTARRFLARCAPLPPDLLLAAIGDSTAGELAALGRPADAVAAEPTPAGIAEALSAAMSMDAPPAPSTSSPDIGRQKPLS